MTSCSLALVGLAVVCTMRPLTAAELEVRGESAVPAAGIEDSQALPAPNAGAHDLPPPGAQPTHGEGTCDLASYVAELARYRQQEHPRTGVELLLSDARAAAASPGLALSACATSRIADAATPPPSQISITSSSNYTTTVGGFSRQTIASANSIAGKGSSRGGWAPFTVQRVHLTIPETVLERLIMLQEMLTETLANAYGEAADNTATRAMLEGQILAIVENHPTELQPHSLPDIPRLEPNLPKRAGEQPVKPKPSSPEKPMRAARSKHVPVRSGHVIPPSESINPQVVRQVVVEQDQGQLKQHLADLLHQLDSLNQDFNKIDRDVQAELPVLIAARQCIRNAGAGAFLFPIHQPDRELTGLATSRIDWTQ